MTCLALIVSLLLAAPDRHAQSDRASLRFVNYSAADGRLWMAGRLVHNQYVEDRSNPHVTLPPWEGMYCIGSYAETGGKLYAFEDHTSLLYTFEDSKPVPLGRLPIAHARLLTTHDGRLWAAGSYGLGPVNTAKPEDTPVYQTASTELYCLFEDRQGNLWVGGDNGLSVLCPALQQVRTLSEDNVTALLEDHNGKMWIGRADACSLEKPLTPTKSPGSLAERKNWKRGNPRDLRPANWRSCSSRHRVTATARLPLRWKSPSTP